MWLVEYLFVLLGRARPRADPLAAIRALQPETIRLLIGLGNPGERFAGTRHNAGYFVVDEIARSRSLEWVPVPDAVALVAVDGPLALVKPLTFMNKSGESARALRDRLGLTHGQMLVIYDDMDLALSALRLRERGSAGTHNGMKSMIRELGTMDFPRLRVGIGQAGAQGALEHVLGRFSQDEEPVLRESIQRAVVCAETWANEGATVAMNRLNRKG